MNCRSFFQCHSPFDARSGFGKFTLAFKSCVQKLISYCRGAVLWAAPMGLLVATQGWDGTLTQMAWFFTKAALLTFSGAYAVLPYVYQGAVRTYGWLTPTQMIDGLALGETTPGPLIMVVAFLPSFIFILAGGPLVESTHGEMKFTGPLTAITAAVVGVILNLALFFGCHVIWPTGFDGSLDWMSVVIALGAALALFASKRNVIHAIGVCAWLGLYL